MLSVRFRPGSPHFPRLLGWWYSMLLAMPTVWAVGMFTQIVAMAMLPSKQMVNCPEVNKKGSDPHGLRVVPDEPRCGPSRDGLGDKKCTTKCESGIEFSHPRARFCSNSVSI